MAPLIEIRKYRDTDRGQCRSLWRELTEWHRKIYQDPTIGGEHPEDQFDKHLAEVGPNQLCVAAHNTKAVGLIGLILKGNEAEIEPLIVSKTHRQKGIGKQLLQTAISEARKKGTRILNIGPVARNTKTIKWLYKQGFKNLGYIQLFIDLTNHRWKPGPKIYGCKFNF